MSTNAVRGKLLRPQDTGTASSDRETFVVKSIQ